VALSKEIGGKRMKYRTLSPDGDYMFGQGNSCFLSGRDAVAQAILTRLKMFQGEFWEDTADGLPFFKSMAGQFDKDLIDMTVRSRILNTPGVNRVVSFSSSINRLRNYRLECTVETNYGNVSVEVG
jgi:hypothetical protein